MCYLADDNMDDKKVEPSDKYDNASTTDASISDLQRLSPHAFSAPPICTPPPSNTSGSAIELAVIHFKQLGESHYCKVYVFRYPSTLASSSHYAETGEIMYWAYRCIKQPVSAEH